MASEQLVITACSVTSQKRSGIYYVGAYARRVSLVTQQMRALNLVWALRKDGAFVKPGASVAVVGAGVAGVTAAYALLAVGCTVDVFDSADAALWRQRHTSHRTIHPNINFWPVDGPPTPTTCLPFLDWHYGVCEDAIGVIETAWNDCVARAEGQIKFWPRSTIVDAWRTPGRAGKIILRKEGGPSPSVEYDAAIVATGFGKESSSKNFQAKQYWKADNLETDRLSGEYDRFVVSGGGDGGLIDSLRLAYEKFQRDHIAHAVAARLARTEVEGLLNSRQYDSVAYQEAVDMIQRDDSYKSTRDLLDRSLKNTQRGSVILADKSYTDPCKSGAAPIHKLLVVFARARGVILYEMAEAIQKGSTIRIGEMTLQAARTLVIIRHGAKPHFGKLLTPKERRELKERQKHLAEYNHQPIWQGTYPVPGFVPVPDVESDAYRTDRRELAQAAMTVFDAHARVGIHSGGYEVFLSKDVVCPPTLFGVTARPTSVSNIREMDALE